MKILFTLSLLLFTLTTSLNAQENTFEIDSSFFNSLVENLQVVHDEFIADIKFYYGIRHDGGFDVDLDRDGKKLKAIIEYLMIYKNVILEIGIHSDCQGKKEYKRRITEIKAKSIKETILGITDSIQHRFIENRLISKGYGDLFLLEKCKCNECTIEQHHVNNRVVLKLIKGQTKKLSGRDGKGPRFEPSAQVEGKITIKVCIDKNGHVIKEESKFIASESTIDNQEIIAQAIETAGHWKFKPADIEKACGTITYVIKLK